jgi:hypothetical protein
MDDSVSSTTKSRPGPSLDDKPLEFSGAPNRLPSGSALITDPNSWYRLRATYVNDSGKTVSGCAYPVGVNAATSFYDYVVFREASNGALQFKLSAPDKAGYSRWTIRDDDANSGYHLDCKATGWLHRASAYDTKFRIVDKKMYMNYRWSGPLGSEYRSFLVSSGQYLGANLPEFTCELELVS